MVERIILIAAFTIFFWHESETHLADLFTPIDKPSPEEAWDSMRYFYIRQHIKVATSEDLSEEEKRGKLEEIGLRQEEALQEFGESDKPYKKYLKGFQLGVLYERVKEFIGWFVITSLLLTPFLFTLLGDSSWAIVGVIIYVLYGIIFWYAYSAFTEDDKGKKFTWEKTSEAIDSYQWTQLPYVVLLLLKAILG